MFHYDDCFDRYHNEPLSCMGAKASQPTHFLKFRLTGFRLNGVDCIAIFMSLHVPAGACIYIIHTHMIQNNLRTPQLAGFARQLGCKNWSKYPPGKWELLGFSEYPGKLKIVY